MGRRGTSAEDEGFSIKQGGQESLVEKVELNPTLKEGLTEVRGWLWRHPKEDYSR